MAITQYMYSKTGEKQRSTFNGDSNWPSNWLSSMTIKSSKDSSKGDNKSSESKCSVNECAFYAHKLIKFNDESNRSDCAIDANAHTVHNFTGYIIPRSTSMNMIQVKDSTFATQHMT